MLAARLAPDLHLGNVAYCECGGGPVTAQAPGQRRPPPPTRSPSPRATRARAGGRPRPPLAFAGLSPGPAKLGRHGRLQLLQVDPEHSQERSCAPCGSWKDRLRRSRSRLVSGGVGSETIVRRDRGRARWLPLVHPRPGERTPNGVSSTHGGRPSIADRWRHRWWRPVPSAVGTSLVTNSIAANAPRLPGRPRHPGSRGGRRPAKDKRPGAVAADRRVSGAAPHMARQGHDADQEPELDQADEHDRAEHDPLARCWWCPGAGPLAPTPASSAAACSSTGRDLRLKPPLLLGRDGHHRLTATSTSPSAATVPSGCSHET